MYIATNPTKIEFPLKTWIEYRPIQELDNLVMDELEKEYLNSLDTLPKIDQVVTEEIHDFDPMDVMRYATGNNFAKMNLPAASCGVSL